MTVCSVLVMVIGMESATDNASDVQSEFINYKKMYIYQALTESLVNQ